MTSRAKLVLIFLLSILSQHSAKSLEISYYLAFPEPHTHYVEVEIIVNGLDRESTDLQLPVWAPGSYKIRDFARNVETFEAFSLMGKVLVFSKTDKTTWRIINGSSKSVRIKYKVYAYEMSVRTSFVDENHGYLNGSSVFMYIIGHKDNPASLEIKPFHTWEIISTALPRENAMKNTFRIENYDHLADCPIEIGNHEVISFDASGVHHEVAIYGPGNYDTKKLKIDFARVIEACTGVFGENPNEYYLFIIHNLDGGGGGLEHANSTTLQVDRWGYMPEHRYKGFLGLVVHEYFHLWNVKRVRPEGYWDIDYLKENYTDALWVLEGFTSYYDEILLKRTGYFTEEEYLRKLAGNLSRVDNRPGNEIQSVTEASMDAWIKFYNQNENSRNTTVSYYTKGSILATMLDLEIIKTSKGKQSLDDVMKYLYHNNYKKTRDGITSEKIKSAIENVSGKKMSDFFAKYVFGTDPVDYAKYLDYAGLELSNINGDSPVPQLGVGTKYIDGKLRVTNVVRGSSAYEAGINVNDEIIAMNDFRVNYDFAEKLQLNYHPGDTLNLILSRDGIIINKAIILQPSNQVRYSICLSSDPGNLQKTVRKKWFTGRPE
ncbi:M61 family metallopeptidase [Bacteroidota bacterium]